MENTQFSNMPKRMFQNEKIWFPFSYYDNDTKLFQSLPRHSTVLALLTFGVSNSLVNQEFVRQVYRKRSCYYELTIVICKHLSLRQFNSEKSFAYDIAFVFVSRKLKSLPRISNSTLRKFRSEEARGHFSLQPTAQDSRKLAIKIPIVKAELYFDLHRFFVHPSQHQKKLLLRL